MGKTALLLNPSSFSEFDKEQHRSQLTITFEFCDTKAPAKLLPVLPKFFISILCNKIHPHAGCCGLLCMLRVMNAISIWEQGGKSFPPFRTLHWMASHTCACIVPGLWFMLQLSSCWGCQEDHCTGFFILLPLCQTWLNHPKDEKVGVE